MMQFLEPESHEILSENVKCYHYRNMLGNSNVMHCGILIYHALLIVICPLNMKRQSTMLIKEMSEQ